MFLNSFRLGTAIECDFSIILNRIETNLTVLFSAISELKRDIEKVESKLILNKIWLLEILEGFRTNPSVFQIPRK